MCGIVGVINHQLQEEKLVAAMNVSLKTLTKRGPDHQEYFLDEHVILGHARLSIIDTSSSAHQPFWDTSGRYCIIFNGEIFNFNQLKSQLINKGFNFQTNSDTEVLLYWLITFGANGLNDLNGFFSLCFYDKLTNEYMIARDRYGIKPLVYSWQNNKLIFASEIKAMLPFMESKDIDKKALSNFFRFNYIPAPQTILQNVYKLQGGEFISIKKNIFEKHRYYECMSSAIPKYVKSYDDAKTEVYNLLEDATQLRMISDVPLGSFLSGGIDSSIVSLIAAKHTKNLNTFSIGFADEPLYDETNFANLVAKKIKSNHTVFSLANNDLLEHFEDALAYLDEPFADSSALNMFILAKKTKESVTVALSGDGADELFSGYNKHEALWLADQGGMKSTLVKNFGETISGILPKSRDSKLGNVGRKLQKFSHGLKLSPQERYNDWASFMSNDEVAALMQSKTEIGLDYLQTEINDFNDYLKRDFELVLQGDMLRKVDAMSMANSLEVRTPFLDYRLVDLVFSMPSQFKIVKGDRKKILKDAFKQELPTEIFNRGKHGFEVPLRKWFSKELKSVLIKEVFNRELIESQGFLDWNTVADIQEKLYSNNPGDAVYNTWALLSFQRWLSNYYYN